MEGSEISIEAHYNQTFIFKRFDNTVDSTGMVSKSSGNWDTVTTVPGLLQELGANERFVKGKDTAFRTHKAFCQIVAVTEIDRLYIGSTAYEIVGFKDPNKRGHHMEIDLRQII